MTTIRSYHHDFPRLAKQSGYFFQLFFNKGKINWTEIDNINVDSIIENRNFQLLEQGLVNVLNCDLDQEYDLKELDKNFVKLFKLAQLGIDYLSYCTLYLDKCVIILQEQLIAAQKECKLLKKKKINENETKKKITDLNFKCDKCEKIFISEVYLKCHDKRRHSRDTKKFSSRENSPKILFDQYQQTEDSRVDDLNPKASDDRVQTVARQDTWGQNDDSREAIICSSEKIKNLEKEVENLKIRLIKAENRLVQKNDELKQSLVSYPSPVSPSLLQLAPQCVPFEMSQSQQTSEATCTIKANAEPLQLESVSVKSTPALEKTEFIEISTTFKGDDIQEEKCFLNVVSAIHTDFASQEESSKTKEDSIPNCSEITSSNAAIPKPVRRKTRKKTNLSFDSGKEREVIRPMSSRETENVDRAKDICKKSISYTSSPKMIKKEEEMDNFEKIQGYLKNNKQDLLGIPNEKILLERKPKWFIQKMVSGSPPSLQEFRNNFKKSLTNLYDSVSSSGKCSSKSNLQTSDSQVEVLKDINISKKTIKQKLLELKHPMKSFGKEKRKQSTTKSPEKNIFKKLGVNYLNLGSRKSNASEKCESEDFGMGTTFRGVAAKGESSSEIFEKGVMYDVETESDSESKLVEILNEDRSNPATKKENNLFIKKEFDFSIFQVGKRENLKDVPVNTETTERLDFKNESEADSEFENDFVDNFINGRYKSEQDKDNRSSKADNFERMLAEAAGIEERATKRKSRTNATGKQKNVSFDDSDEINFVEMGSLKDTSNVASNLRNEYTWSVESDWDESDVSSKPVQASTQ